jgi:fructosamine-3-kinase
MDQHVQNLIKAKLSEGKLRFISVGGGSINETFRIENDSQQWFCKINSSEHFPSMFEKERNGLEFLRTSDAIKVPEVIWHGQENGKQILILEWIEQGVRSNGFWKRFGEQLAQLHSSSEGPRLTISRSSDRDGQTRFGFHEDNYMGALPQLNSFKENWIEFFVQCRLEPQLQLAASNGLINKRQIEQFESLYKKLNKVFPIESPSPLHGDLWSGNFLCGKGEAPVLIDPAVYYGHRCIDLGMTRLFGGFDKIFYEAYDYHYSLPENFEEQADVCNLYPLLIHLNLFGSGYLSSIQSILYQFM